MILDRKTPPKIKPANQVDFLKAETTICSNGIPIHYINHGDQDVIRLQLAFDAGTYYQAKPLLAAAVNNLLLEGTDKYSSQEIANYFENRGAFVQGEVEADKGIIHVYSLTKNLAELLPFLYEVISSATFPDDELASYLSIQQQNFGVNSQKVGFMAKNNFLNVVLGERSPYASKVEANDYENITRNDLIEFYNNYYKEGQLSVFASGKITPETSDLIEKVFGSDTRKGLTPLDNATEVDAAFSQNELLLPKENALQSAIRMGKPIISKQHEDFPALFFTNTVLGGYFGSRLMSNIREDKGYTYGVGSGLVSYKNAAYFLISTEVGAEVTEATVSEIKIELKRLQNEPLDEKELNLVKNYLRGSILKNFDGAFAAMDRFRSINTLGLDYDYYENLMRNIQDMTAVIVQETAKRYLQLDSLKKIIAGKV